MAQHLDGAQLAVLPQNWSHVIIWTFFATAAFRAGILIYNYAQEDRLRLQKRVPELTSERDHLVVALAILMQALQNAKTTGDENVGLIQATIKRLEAQKELATQLKAEKAQLWNARDLASTACKQLLGKLREEQKALRGFKDEKTKHEQMLQEQLQASKLEAQMALQEKLRAGDVLIKSEQTIKELTSLLHQPHQANEATVKENKGTLSEQGDDDKEVPETYRQLLVDLKQAISDKDRHMELLKSAKASQQRENDDLKQQISTMTNKTQMHEEDDAGIREAISGVHETLSDMSAQQDRLRQQVQDGEATAKQHGEQLRKADESLTAKIAAYDELSALYQSQQDEFALLVVKYAALEAKHAKGLDDRGVAALQNKVPSKTFTVMGTRNQRRPPQ